MIEVDQLFTGDHYKTQFYASRKVIDAICDPKKNPARRQFHQYLERYAKNGFDRHISKKGPIKPELGIFRIGIQANLFRVYGFFNVDGKKFIALDAFLKKKGQLNSSERQRIMEVVRIKDEKLWKEKFHDKSEN